MSHAQRLRILVLYEPYALSTNFVADHLASFKEHLPHDVWYAIATCDVPLRFNLEA